MYLHIPALYSLVYVDDIMDHRIMEHESRGTWSKWVKMEPDLAFRMVYTEQGEGINILVGVRPVHVFVKEVRFSINGSSIDQVNLELLLEICLYIYKYRSLSSSIRITSINRWSVLSVVNIPKHGYKVQQSEN